MNAKDKTSSFKAVPALALAVGLAAMLSADEVGRGQAVDIAVQPAANAAAPRPEPPAAVPAAPAEEGAPAATQPGGLMDRAVDSGAQIYVDDSFASVEKLRAAMRLDHQKQGALAIQKYQEIIDDFGQKLLYLNNDSYVSLTDYVRDLLLNMEAVQKGQYDQFYGLQAQKSIDAAVEARDLPALIRACDRYFPASAVVQGLNQAAEWYFERGDFASAGRAWQLLCRHPRATAQLPEFLHHAALAQKLAGREDVARQLRDRLAKDYPDASGTIQGQSVPLVENINAALKQAPWEQAAVSPDEWPMFAGSATRNIQTEASSMAGTRLWTVNLDDIAGGAETAQSRRAADEARRRVRYGGDGEVDQSPPLGSFPVVSNGQLFVHNGDRIVSLSANAGALLWAYPEKVTTPRTAPQPAYVYARMGAGRGMHDSCTIYQDQVFAVLPAPNVPITSTGRGMIYSAYNMAQNTRVVALSRGDGKERWSTVSSSIQIPTKGTLSFVGSPLVTRQGVFLLARATADAFSRLYLVRLDRDTGAVTWVCYVCSSSAGGMYGGMMPMGMPLAAMAEDVVYITTGQGADCAVDANAGRILWLQVTESAKTVRSPSEFYNGGAEVKPAWKANPPLIWRDKLITAESGSAIRIYDRWNGRLVARLDPKKKDSPVENSDIVLGVVGHDLITVGTKIHCVNLENGKEAWPAVELSSSSEQRRKWGPLQGRPFLTKQYLYLPMKNGVAMLDVTKGAGGAELSGTIWSEKPQPGKEPPPKPGNLLVTSEQVLIVNDTTVAGFSTWEAAEARRLADIAAHPNEPKPYLDLAEVAFRTEKYDIAEKNMTRAVELAVAQPGDGELLQRIYRTNLGFAEQLAARSGAEEQARARFYYEQCKATARDAEPSAEWRLSMAPWAQTQKLPDEAAALYNEVLNDPAMRNAAFRRGENMTRAGIAAESELKGLIKQHGRDTLYRKFEDQAAAALAKAEAQKDAAQLQQVADAYPNSMAALTAAREVAQIQKDRKQYAAEIRTLHWIYQRVATDPEKARIAADLAQAHAAVSRWGAALSWTDRGFRLAKDLSWQDNGRAMTFAALRADLKAIMPAVQEARRPALTLPLQMDLDDNRQGKATTSGLLLVPLETSPALRRPDAMLVYGQTDGKIRLFDAPGLTEKWSCTLKDNPGPLVLLGYTGNTAVLVAANRAFGIDLAAGQLRWEIPMDVAPEDAVRNQEQAQRLRAIQMQQAVMGGINGPIIINGDIDQPGNMNVYQQMAMDPEQLRATQFQSALGRPAFNTLRLVNGRLVMVTGNTLNAYDVSTGKRAWPNPVTLPDGNCNVVVANEDLIVAQVDSVERGTPTFVAIEAETGRWHGTVKLENERVLWRSVGEEGTLFIVSDQRASAYDLHGDLTRDLWHRDLKTRFPAASALTLDGLVLINANNELVCLGQDTGEQRWPLPNDPPLRIDTMMGQSGWTNLRTFVDGDTLVVQSGKGVHAYQTADGRVAWEGAFLDDIPPLVSSQFSDPYLVLMGTGATKSAQRAVTIFLLNRVNPVTGELNNGKIDKTIPLTRQRDSAEGPIIRAWQIIDGGLAMEIGGNIYVYRSVKADPAAPR